MIRAILLALLLTGCSTTPQAPLPHRPPTGNHGQGESPPATCPEQYNMTVDVAAGGQIFIYCWGKKTPPADQ